MKTRILMIVGLLILSTIIMIVFFTFFGIFYIFDNDNSQSQRIIEDPLCFAIPNTTRGELCYPLEELSDYGCSKLVLEHLAKYSNIIEYEWNEMFYIEWVSLPSNISEKNFDTCIEFLNSVRLPEK